MTCSDTINYVRVALGGKIVSVATRVEDGSKVVDVFIEGADSIKRFFELSDDDEAKIAALFPNGAEIKQGLNPNEEIVKEILSGQYMSVATVIMRFKYRRSNP